MSEYFSYRPPHQRSELVKLYPGKVRHGDRDLCICQACGGYFTTNRRDKKVCDAACRALLGRQRSKLPQQLQIDDPPWAAPF